MRAAHAFLDDGLYSDRHFFCARRFDASIQCIASMYRFISKYGLLTHEGGNSAENRLQMYVAAFASYLG
jgi:hypothetical protein